MIAKVLQTALKKVRLFASDKFDLANNVLIYGENKKLTLSCCDGNSGIVETVNITGSSIDMNCCVDVYKFSKFIEAVNDDEDLNIFINKKEQLVIEGSNFKSYLDTMSPNRMFNIPKPQKWQIVDLDFVNEIKIISDTENLDPEIPIINSDEYLYYANPKACVMLKTKYPDIQFMVTKKFLKKIIIDDFRKVSIENGQFYLGNDNCEIFIPLFAGNKIKLLPILNKLNELHIHTLFIDAVEFKYITKLFTSEYESNDFDVISVSIDQEKIRFQSGYSEIETKKIVYEGPNVNFKIPKYSLTVGSKEYFKTNELIKFKIADPMTMFVVTGNDIIYFNGTKRT